MQDKILAATKQNLANSKFPNIDTFDHQGTVGVRTIRVINSGVFENLEIPSPLDIDKRVNCTKRLLRWLLLKKYKDILTECKETLKGISGGQWMIGEVKDGTMDRFWTWEKINRIDTYGTVYSGVDSCIDSGKDIWLVLGNIMWKKHRSVFQDHVKYIHNDIVKHSRVRIIQYAERDPGMNDLAKYLTPP